MKKGIILEIKERYVTLLTPEGEFMRTRKLQQDYQIGAELYFYPMETEEGKRSVVLTSLKGMKGRLILLSLVMFLAVVLFPVYESRPAYAYMSIDVNPSIELGLNENLLVISMEAFNQEGEEVLEKMTDWKKEKAVDVATQILNEIEGMGYLNQEKEVLISTVRSEESSTDEELVETVKELQKISDEEELVVTVVTATPEERENAVKQGMSAGVYKQKQGIANEEEPSAKEKVGKDKPNKSEAPEKKSSPNANPSSIGQENGKGHTNEKGQQNKEPQINNKEKTNKNDREDNKNKNNGNQHKDHQNKGNQNKGHQNKEAINKGNGNASNGKNQNGNGANQK